MLGGWPVGPSHSGLQECAAARSAHMQSDAEVELTTFDKVSMSRMCML